MVEVRVAAERNRLGVIKFFWWLIREELLWGN
jgi:hypothetical protein